MFVFFSWVTPAAPQLITLRLLMEKSDACDPGQCSAGSFPQLNFDAGVYLVSLTYTCTFMICFYVWVLCLFAFVCLWVPVRSLEFCMGLCYKQISVNMPIASLQWKPLCASHFFQDPSWVVSNDWKSAGSFTVTRQSKDKPSTKWPSCTVL